MGVCLQKDKIGNNVSQSNYLKLNIKKIYIAYKRYHFWEKRNKNIF